MVATPVTDMVQNSNKKDADVFCRIIWKECRVCGHIGSMDTWCTNFTGLYIDTILSANDGMAKLLVLCLYLWVGFSADLKRLTIIDSDRVSKVPHFIEALSGTYWWPYRKNDVYRLARLLCSWKMQTYHLRHILNLTPIVNHGTFREQKRNGLVLSHKEIEDYGGGINKINRVCCTCTRQAVLVFSYT